MDKTGKRLYSYVIKQKKKILLGVLATLLMSIVELFTGSLLKFLINLVDEFSGSFAKGLSEAVELPVKYQLKLPLFNEKLTLIKKTLVGGDEIFAGMLKLCLLFIGLYFFLALFNYLRRVFMNAATQRILQNFKADIYNKILRLPFSFFGRNKTGDLVSRITYDVTTLSEIIDLLIEVARALVYVLVFIPVMFIMSWQLSLFTVLFFPLSIFLINYITRYIKRVSKSITDNVGDYTAFLEEKINRFKLIKGFRKEQKEGQAFEHLVEENYQHNLQLIKLKFFLNPANDFLAMIALAIVYLFYSFRLTEGHTTLGDIVFYLYLVKTAYKPVKKVAQAWGQLHIALVSTRKIFHLMDEGEEEIEMAELPKIETVNKITFNDVAFSYPSDSRQVLKSVSFEAERGEIIGIKGKTGAGKTTLLSLLPGFYFPDNGTIKINDIDYINLSLNSLRQTVAHVGSDPLLVNGTVRQNLEYSGHVLDKSIEEKVTSFIGLQNSTELDMPIGKSGMNLSDGQKHKVAFIRAVLSQPRVLILDEVFSSLDEEDLTYLFEWCKKADVVFLVSRKKEVLTHADRLLTICHGEVVEKV